MAAVLSIRKLNLLQVYTTYFKAGNKEEPADLACSVAAECVEKILDEGTVLICVLREPFRKSRAICFGTFMVIG